MIITATVASALELAHGPIYVADLGSNVPHSVCIEGNCEQLIDPPILPVVAKASPQLLEDF